MHVTFILNLKQKTLGRLGTDARSGGVGLPPFERANMKF